MKIAEKILTDTTFTDDCAMMAYAENNMKANKFGEVCQFFGLQISISKTDILYQTSPVSEASSRLHKKIDGTECKIDYGFKYQGSIISSYRTMNRLKPESPKQGRLWGDIIHTS